MYPSMNTTELGNSTKNKFADFSDTEDFHGGEATAAGGRPMKLYLKPDFFCDRIIIYKGDSRLWINTDTAEIYIPGR